MMNAEIERSSVDLSVPLQLYDESLSKWGDLRNRDIEIEISQELHTKCISGDRTPIPLRCSYMFSRLEDDPHF